MDEDFELVERAKAGVEEAFEELVERHQRRVFTIAFRMTGSYDDACDITQDAFLSAYRGIKKFRGEAKFSTWLHTITVHRVRDFQRKDINRTRKKSFSLDEPRDTPGEGKKSEAPSDDMEIERQIERKELQKNVQKCIDALEDEHREIIILRDFQDLSYEEIGEILKLAPGTVKSRIFRAREQLKNLLQSALEEY